MASIETVALTGLKHVGKSTIGRALARRLDRRFDDLDDLLAAEYHRHVSIDADAITVTPRDIYRRGVVLFQRMEHSALTTYLFVRSQHKHIPCILATGGGICDNDAAFSLLSARTTTIFFDEKVEVLYRRIIAEGIPPFLDADRPEEHFYEIAERRRHAYLATADHVITTSGLTPAAVGDAIIQIIR